MRWRVFGRELYATGSAALEQQLYLNTWLDIHSAIVRPTPQVAVKATIPEETFALDPEDPNPYGGTARAEMNFSFVLEEDPDTVQALAAEIIAEMSSTEVMGYVSNEEVT